MTLNAKLLSHHAYCLIGSDPTHLELKAILKKEHGIEAQGNPDFFDRTYETFTIDNAREIKSAHETRPASDAGKKIFILVMNAITVEAQNALLKLLEEPSEYSHFFIIIPSAHLLLPTVRSRISFLSLPSGNKRDKGGHNAEMEGFSANSELMKVTKIFVTSTKSKRLELIKGLLDDISKEKRPKRDAVDFLNAIQEDVYRNGGAKKRLEALRSIEKARKYAHDRAPSMKMLLEYVALNI